jgi:hypothetical protein
MGKLGSSQLTRRGFLRGLGTSAAGLAVVGYAGCSLQNQAAAKPAGDPLAKSSLTKHPFAYAKLDPDKSAERAYKAYFKGG